MHRLNLILVDSCKSVSEARDFFLLLEKLYVFFSGSVIHKRWTEVQNELYPDTPVRHRLSDTRWSCRVVACRNARDRLDALIYTLEDIAEDSNAERALEANSLLSMLDLNFVLLLHLFCDLLGKVHGVSTMLQSATVDLSAAAQLVQDLLALLTDIRADNSYINDIVAAAIALCTTCKIETAFKQRRVRKLPR